MTKRLLAFAALLIASPMLFAQQTPSMTRNPDAPLQLISTKATLTDFLDTVTMRNVSPKRIVSFQLGLVLTAPAPCSTVTKIAATDRPLPADRISVNPGDTIATNSYRVPPQEFAQFEVAHSGHEVFSQLAVTHVEFSDGTSWSLTRSGSAFDDHLLQEDLQLHCGAKPKASL